MAEFTVIMPFAGAITVTVEAENQHDAIGKFYEKVENVRFSTEEVEKIDADINWDFYETMGQGNVNYYQFNEVEIIKTEEKTED